MTYSIVTICYNNLLGLIKTRESIVSQTFKDYEWIVIDGGSTDGTKEFLQCHSDEFAYWCSEKDKGVYNAQNKGIAIAKGDYIICMNSGDVFHDSEVLSAVSSLGFSADIMYGDWLRVYPNGKTEKKEAPKKLPPYFFYYSNICHQAMFIRREVMQSHPFDEAYAVVADWAKWRELREIGCTFGYLPITVCDFEAGTGLSERFDEKCAKDHERLKSAIPPEIQQDIDGITKDLRDYISKQDRMLKECNELSQMHISELNGKIGELQSQLDNKYVQKVCRMMQRGGIRKFFLRMFMKII